MFGIPRRSWAKKNNLCLYVVPKSALLLSFVSSTYEFADVVPNTPGAAACISKIFTYKILAQTSMRDTKPGRLCRTYSEFYRRRG
jgi:hypothetical protein